MEKEQLINSVYNRRPIWNQSHPDHKNRYILDRLWAEVAEECQSTVKAVQAKWKNLRDYFRNEIKKIPIPKSGDPGDIAPKSHWPYFKNLMFLKDQILPRQSQSNLPEDNAISGNDDSNLEENQSSRPQLDQLPDEDYHTQPESVDQSLPPTPSSSATDEPRTILAGRYRKRPHQIDALISIEKEKMQYLIEKQSKKVETSAADEDKLFFESILPHVKKIEDCNKLKFRNEVQTLVQKYAYKPMPLQTFQIITPDDDSNIALYSDYQ